MIGGSWHDPAHGRETLGRFLDRWLAGELPTKALRPSTTATYETLAKLYISPGLGERQLRSIRRRDITDLLAQMQRRGVGGATREKVHSILRRCLGLAVTEGLIPANVAERLNVRGLPEDVRSPRFCSASEVERLADAISEVPGVESPERYRALVLVAAWCGPRIGELAALRVRHLDMLRRRILIEASTTYVRGRRVEGLTKNRRPRSVPVPKTVWGELLEHLASFVDATDETALVFTGPDGAPLRPDNFRKRVYDKATTIAEITPPPTVHDLRHSAASLMAKQGYSLRQAQEILGHSTTYMTARYTHLFPEDLDAMTDRLDAAIGEAREARRGGVRELIPSEATR